MSELLTLLPILTDLERSARVGRRNASRPRTSSARPRLGQADPRTRGLAVVTMDAGHDVMRISFPARTQPQGHR